MLETPVLFMVFNRPDNTARVLERIIAARPKTIFVSADGPRAGNAEDVNRCASVRALIDSLPAHIEIQRLFRKGNLGCKNAGASALKWFFSEVDRGIVLEDDCVPDLSFFSFCEAALTRYEHEDKVMLISGHNPFGAFPVGSDSVLSKYPFIWGWASWRRAWKYYRAEIGQWDSDAIARQLKKWLGSHHSVFFWRKAFRDAARGAEVWDYQLNYAMFVREALAVVSGKNLVSNIGFGPDAVHTTDPGDNRKTLPVFAAPQAPQFPDFIIPDPRFERRVVRKFYFNRDLTVLGWAKKKMRLMFSELRQVNATNSRGDSR